MSTEKISLFGSAYRRFQQIMDCNREQALKTKRAAERKFAENDHLGAKTLAQKAKDLCPGLDFISLFITVIDVYLSREKGWHAVLGLPTTATPSEISKKYYNLFHSIKVEKNNVVGAQGALQLISQALCILTDTCWTTCTNCRFRFHVSNYRIQQEIVCYNCNERYVAVALPFGSHPMNPQPLYTFERIKREVVLALCAKSAKPDADGQSSQPIWSNRMKRKDAKFTMFGYPDDVDADTNSDPVTDSETVTVTDSDTVTVTDSDSDTDTDVDAQCKC